MLTANNSPFKGCQSKYLNLLSLICGEMLSLHVVLTSIGVFITNWHEERAPKMEFWNNCLVILQMTHDLTITIVFQAGGHYLHSEKILVFPKFFVWSLFSFSMYDMRG